jgi:diguanylate cyclase (GGDEF)-like protein
VVLATLRDISERKQVATQILQMARHDGLTGLANRAVFMEAVQQAIARAKRGGKDFAVLYLDLDRFKDVNDTLGHPVGDELLKAVAERLRSSAREIDTVARFGGDEFAVIAADIGEPADAAILAEALIASLSAPFSIEGNDIRSGASIGISIFGADDPDAETLLSHADVALYRAKSEDRGGYRFFTEAMDSDVRTRVTLSTELREAIFGGQLFLVYQPQVEIATGKIVGVEALVRWRHPARGILGPDLFIPVAEKSGLILALGHWVLMESCRQAKVWIDAGVAPPRMAVNFSAMQFKRPVELELDIAASLAGTGLPAQRLELELTETALMEASRAHNDVLMRLRQTGVRFAIDDFGTGFSSLDYLRRYPADRVKIAQIFVRQITTDAGSAAIVKAIIGLARELGMMSIAEGIETAEQLALLEGWGCQEAQGYFFARPLEPDKILPLLLRGRILVPTVLAGRERKKVALGASRSRG